MFAEENLNKIDKKKTGFACVGCSLFVFTLVVLLCGITTVSAGHAGVVVLYGSVYDEPLDAGLHFINPFAKVEELSLRTKMLEYVNTVPSKEGLGIGLQIAMQYNLNRSSVTNIYKTLDKNYEDILLRPLLSATLREISSNREAKAMYTSTDRVAMHFELDAQMKKYLHPKGFTVQEILLRNIELPAKLKDAIENKLQMEQESERMEFVLQKEQKEAQRKKIEAEGIHQFQQIVAQGIDDNLLRWKGIEATLDLSKSNNSKVVVVGGSDGLPLILNN